MADTSCNGSTSHLQPPRNHVEEEQSRIADELAGLAGETDPFVSAVRATRMPMIVTNPQLPDNPIVYANAAFCRLTGYRRDEVIGRNCRFLQGPDTDQESVARIRAAVDSAQYIELDIFNYRKDGTSFWNRLLIGPVRDQAGDLAYFFASQLDITAERERLAGLETDKAALMAELTGQLFAQQQRERDMAYAMRAGQLGGWNLELAGLQLTASESCKELFGRTPEQTFTYQDRLEAILPADRGLVELAMGRVLEEQADYDVTFRIVRPDGVVRWLSAQGQTSIDEDGRPLRLAGVTRDVTAERRADRLRTALVELSNIFRRQDDPDQISFSAAELIGSTLQVSGAGYGLIDPVAETIVIARGWNGPAMPGAAGTFRLRDFGSYIDDLHRGETVVVADVRLDPRTRDTAAALEAISVRSFVKVPLTEQGRLVALLYLCHPEARAWPDDELSLIREVAERTREATERRRAEKRLAQLAASLETEVQQRTQELMTVEEALRQSQKMEAVGQLTGGLAHDFNNLLTGVSGSLELLQARIAQGRLKNVDRYVTAAQGAAKRAAALTHRLLAFARRQTLAPKPTDVNRLVRGMEELIQRTVGPEITVEPLVGMAGLWPTLVDPGQLENALLNLCINARDAMPDGGKITIETGNSWIDERMARDRDLVPGQYVSLCVSDTGSGMTPEVIAKAFDPFFTTKPVGQGTGLGLSMIYGFAKQSGGQVRIYSEIGQGTMVRIYLPRHLGLAEMPELSPELSDALQGESGQVVLVVDDEPVVRMLVSEVLQDAGYMAIEAADGAAGLKVLQSNARIDLLVTDVGLPGGMNGRQVAEAARILRPHLKVLFITGYAENAVLSHGHLDADMDILTKPFSMEAIAGRIREMIASG